MRVLAVQDDAPTAEWLVACLHRLGYQATCVKTGEEALEVFGHSDLVLLDLELSDIDGLDVCRGIRAAGGTPVIAFACGGSEVDRVLGLQAGADDCIGKPYGLRELAARIEAVMRRVHPRMAGGAVIEHGGLRIDPRTREVTVGGRAVAVTRKEFDLLHLLAAHPGKVFSREELMSRVWHEPKAAARHSARASRTLDTHVGTLRNKIGNGGWIVTVRGVGFRLGPGDNGI